MKDLHADFVKRVSGTNGIVQHSQELAQEAIKHTALTVYYKKDESRQLLVVAKYVWLQTDTDERIPSVEAMIQSQIYLFGDEIRLFNEAVTLVKANILDAE